jgi:hypothetical protein
MDNNITNKPIDISPDLIIFRLDELKRGFDEMRRDLNEKFRSVPTRKELDAVIQERNDKIEVLARRVGKVESSRRIKETVMSITLACSLVINLLTAYELMRGGM